MLFLEPFGATHAGKVRANNEDALLVGEGRDETLFVVADGIGGFEAGEVASRIAVDVLKELEPGASFEAAIGEANRRILAAGAATSGSPGWGRPSSPCGSAAPAMSRWPRSRTSETRGRTCCAAAS